MGNDTVLDVLEAAEGYLRQRGVEAPRLSTEWMLGHVLGMSRIEVYMAHDRPLEETEKVRLRAMVARRGKGEPLAYVLGDQEFCGFTFAVDASVLIPRPETEHLVELAKDLVPEGAHGIDVGTGSGAIAVALSKLRPDLTMLATDVSEAALEVAKRNATTLGVADRVEFLAGRGLEPLGDRPPLDFLISNPPYVDPELPELLAEDVREFEPAVALFTPPGDSGAVYREILDGVAGRMKPGALLLFETGVGADQAALSAARDCTAVTDAELRTDAAGLPRYLIARVRSDDSAR